MTAATGSNDSIGESTELTIFPPPSGTDASVITNGREVTDKPSFGVLTIIYKVCSLVQNVVYGFIGLFYQGKATLAKEVEVKQEANPAASTVQSLVRNVLNGDGEAALEEKEQGIDIVPADPKQEEMEIDEKQASLDRQMQNIAQEIEAQQALIDAAKVELANFGVSKEEAQREHEQKIALKTKYEEAQKAYDDLPAKDKVAAVFGDVKNYFTFLPVVKVAVENEKSAEAAEKALLEVIEELQMKFAGSVSEELVMDQKKGVKDIPVVDLSVVENSVHQAEAAVEEFNQQISAATEKIKEMEEELAAKNQHVEELSAQKQAFSLPQPQKQSDSFALPLVDEVQDTVSAEAVAAVEQAKIATVQQQMLEDLSMHTHPEIAKMWELALNKFAEANHGEEAVTSWQLNPDQTFKIVLAKPFTMWVSDPDYPNKGVEMLFGVNTQGIIEGTLVKGNLSKNHSNMVESTLMKSSNQSAKKTAVAGMVFTKNRQKYAGVQTYCNHAGFWPQAQVEHFLRVGDTESGKMNLIISATATVLCITKTEGRLKSIEFLEKTWSEDGRILPDGFDRTKYINMRGEKKSHEQIVGEKK